MSIGIYKRTKPHWRKGKCSKIEFKCKFCGISFFDYKRSKKYGNRERKFCSKKCFNNTPTGIFIKGHPPHPNWLKKWIKPKISVECKICNKKISVLQSRLNANRGMTCSKICGNKLASQKRVQNGNGQSIERRKKMSALYSGENSWNWKGGKSSEYKRIRNGIDFRLWREAVFARDNWTCQKTGIRGGKLHPHHIQNFTQFPELRFAIDNGIALSEKAHIEFHKKYGKKNNTKEQINEFLK